MLCLSKFVTKNHAKTGFMCSENVVSPSKLKKPTRFYLIKQPLTSHWMLTIHLSGEKTCQEKAEDTYSQPTFEEIHSLPCVFAFGVLYSCFTCQVWNNLLTSLQDCSGGCLREGTPLKCFFGKVIKGFKNYYY